MKKILIILPYFGKFPPYFNLFLKSCATNHTIDWLIVTDQSKNSYSVPDNIIWVNTTFQHLSERIIDLFQIAPQSPYDLCKYRAAYHRIFSDYVGGYDFWGFCDCDLIFGDIRHFVTEKILSQYAKISWRGHLTLFKNEEPYNSAYLKEIDGYKTFRGCITGSDGVNLFDEVGINRIFDYCGYPIYTKLPLCDLKIRAFNFICNHDIFDESSNRFQIFKWNGGRLFRLYAKDNKVFAEEVIYVHFLKRDMLDSDKIVPDAGSYLIVPNRFMPDRTIDYETLMKLSKPRFYIAYWKKRMNIRFILKKIREKLSKTAYEIDQYKPAR